MRGEVRACELFISSRLGVMDRRGWLRRPTRLRIAALRVDDEGARPSEDATEDGEELELDRS